MGIMLLCFFDPSSFLPLSACVCSVGRFSHAHVVAVFFVSDWGSEVCVCVHRQETNGHTAVDVCRVQAGRDTAECPLGLRGWEREVHTADRHWRARAVMDGWMQNACVKEAR